MLNRGDVARSTRKDGDHQERSVFKTFLEIDFKSWVCFFFFPPWNLHSSIQQQNNISNLYRILLLMQFSFFCAKGLDRKTQLAGTGKNQEVC